MDINPLNNVQSMMKLLKSVSAISKNPLEGSTTMVKVLDCLESSPLSCEEASHCCIQLCLH